MYLFIISTWIPLEVWRNLIRVCGFINIHYFLQKIFVSVKETNWVTFKYHSDLLISVLDSNFPYFVGLIYQDSDNL